MGPREARVSLDSRAGCARREDGLASVPAYPRVASPPLEIRDRIYEIDYKGEGTVAIP